VFGKSIAGEGVCNEEQEPGALIPSLDRCSEEHEGATVEKLLDWKVIGLEHVCRLPFADLVLTRPQSECLSRIEDSSRFSLPFQIRL
jgi:hypothetical protein